MKLLCDIDILGVKPIPWSAPDVGVMGRGTGKTWRVATKKKALVSWQEYVALAIAGRACKPDVPELGPILIDLTFYRKAPRPELVGAYWPGPVAWSEKAGKFTKRGPSTADTTNLFKGTEDALQNVLYGDDVQAVETRSRRLYGTRDGVRVRVYAVDVDGPGDDQ